MASREEFAWIELLLVAAFRFCGVDAEAGAAAVR